MVEENTRNKPEAAVISTFMCPYKVFETVLGTAIVTAAVRQRDCGASHPEKAIRNKHRPVPPWVPIVTNHLSAHYNSIVVWVRLQHVSSQVHCYEPSTAAHPTKIVAQNIASHFLVVDDHCRERWSWIEDAAVHNKDSNILGSNPCLLKELIECPKHHS